MTLEHQRTTKVEDGTEKDCLRMEFTNGALKQLVDLQDIVKGDDPADVVKFAIAFLQKLKDQDVIRPPVPQIPSSEPSTKK